MEHKGEQYIWDWKQQMKSDDMCVMWWCDDALSKVEQVIWLYRKQTLKQICRMSCQRAGTSCQVSNGDSGHERNKIRLKLHGWRGRVAQSMHRTCRHQARARARRYSTDCLQLPPRGRLREQFTARHVPCGGMFLWCGRRVGCSGR